MVRVPESELLGATRHKSLQTTEKYMRKDHNGETKRIMATLNASRPPKLKVSTAAMLEKRIVPFNQPNILTVTPRTPSIVAPLPRMNFFNNLQNRIQLPHSTLAVPFPAGMTNFTSFPPLFNNYYYPTLQYQVPSTIVQYQGNVNINFNYGTDTSTSKSSTNNMSISDTSMKMPYNPYIRKPKAKCITPEKKDIKKASTKKS